MHAPGLALFHAHLNIAGDEVERYALWMLARSWSWCRLCWSHCHLFCL